MVKRIERDVAPQLDKLNAQDGAAIISHSLSSSSSQSKDNFFNDDLIVSLADAHENKRARQVNEWERQQHIARVY